MEPGNQELIQLVLKALENPKYKWRTTLGLAEETGLPEERVLETLSRVSDQLVKLPVPSSTAADLYTTRERFRESASFTEKLLGVLKNRSA